MNMVPEIVFTSNKNYELEECADVAFVALGTLQLAGEQGITALRNVLMKNNKKSWITHFRDVKTGKITRLAAPEQWWEKTIALHIGAWYQ